MKNLHFAYLMTIGFDAPVTKHSYSLKCCPLTNERQKVENLTVTVNGKEVRTTDTDVYGNILISGAIPEAHTSFEVIASGEVQTGLDICESYDSEIARSYIYKHFTAMTFPGEKLTDVFKKSDIKIIETPYDRALYLFRLTSGLIKYQKGVTDISTTAEQALSGGHGVCQDYAHIMLALCRMAGLPCRYVVGMMLGEGESHAWTEVLCRGVWYGFDPTNNKLVDDNYIKISCGRDYHDCTVNKGVFYGFANQHQSINVSVIERNE